MKTFTDAEIRSHKARMNELMRMVYAQSSSADVVEAAMDELTSVYFTEETELGRAVFQDICGTRKSSEDSNGKRT